MCEQEIMVWVRHCGQSQARVSELLRQQQDQLQQLQQQLMRLRAWRMVEHTHKLWGVPQPSQWRAEPSLKKPEGRGLLGLASQAWRQLTNKVICQTGCEGHGHPWLQEQGQCSRTGEACTSVQSVEPQRCA